MLLYARVGVPRCSQAGSCSFRFFDILMGAKLMLCFLAVFSNEINILGSVFVLGPCVGGDHLVRKTLISFFDVMPFGCSVLIRASAIYAHVGRILLSDMYELSHVISMAWFLLAMSRRFIPPSFCGLYSLFRSILGVDPSQMKFLIILIIAFSMFFGMPCAFVRNCVIPPTVICIIRRLPFREGLPSFHRSSVFEILSSVGSHVAAFSTLFPIHAPRVRIGWPSAAILICGFHGVSFSFSFLSFRIFCLACSVPIGRISVFSRLNFAPDASHQVFSISCRVS